MHRSLLSLPRVTITCVATLTLAACKESAEPTSSDARSHSTHVSRVQATDLPAGVRQEIARLRAATAAFRDFQTAVNAGWGTQITGCFQDPALGGMGYHYGNTALIDGTVEALKPELLLYEPRKNGKHQFVAVEYIVPFTAWTSDEPPQLYGQSFHRNQAFGIWALHVWTVRRNPSGIFADWNPRVACD